jgi:hypothetical protein
MPSLNIIGESTDVSACPLIELIVCAMFSAPLIEEKGVLAGYQWNVPHGSMPPPPELSTGFVCMENDDASHTMSYPPEAFLAMDANLPVNGEVARGAVALES